MNAKTLNKILLAGLFGAMCALLYPASRVANAQSSDDSGGQTPQLDYEYFKTRVEPIFLMRRSPDHARCYVCHQMMRHNGGPLSLQMLSPGASFWTEEQSRKNFKTVSRLVVPGDPSESLLLRMPLAPEAGGLADTHQGGRQFASENDPQWKVIKAWVMGEKGGGSAKP